MSLGHPFQKLCYLKASSDLPEALLAASGPYICCYDFQKGLVARWPTGDEEGKEEDEDLPDIERQDVNGDGGGERPAKRRRLSGDEDGLMARQDSEESFEIISERVKGQRRKPKPLSKTKLPDVSHVLATSNGKNIVVVTADDKCIRVLERSKSGKLRDVSERCMPKRICAITLTRNERTIVAGDKFGDVYSLPLFPSGDALLKMSSVGQKDAVTDFKPSASELTVHTKGNLEALRQQQQQKNFKPKKEGLTFEHRLLLGHVSLLTDLAIAEVEGHAGRRQYILTADRDEHIRVSRGISQAHVIENYCLGHTEFVSKLCILPWQTTTLIAGSGEPSLKVYDWRKGLCSTDLLAVDGTLDKVKGYIKAEGQDRSTDNLAVSGIWPAATDKNQGCILVALEGLPLLLSFACHGEISARAQIIQLPGNVLDVAVAEAGTLLLVSIDTIHQPCSMKARRNEAMSQEDAIVSFVLQDGVRGEATDEPSVVPEEGKVLPLWTRSSLSAIDKALACEPVTADVEPEEEGKRHKPHSVYSKLGEFLYGLENLRKYRGQEDLEADEEPEPEVGANGAAQDEDLKELK